MFYSFSRYQSLYIAVFLLRKEAWCLFRGSEIIVYSRLKASLRSAAVRVHTTCYCIRYVSLSLDPLVFMCDVAWWIVFFSSPHLVDGTYVNYECGKTAYISPTAMHKYLLRPLAITDCQKEKNFRQFSCSLFKVGALWDMFGILIHSLKMACDPKPLTGSAQASSSLFLSLLSLSLWLSEVITLLVIPLTPTCPLETCLH